MAVLWVGGAFLALFFFWGVVCVGGFAVWLWGLIDAARRPDWAFRAGGTDKTMWIVLIAVLGFIPALIYLVGFRQRVRDAEAAGVTWATPSSWPGWPASTPAGAAAATPGTCPRCGTPRRVGAAFCATCGVRVG